MIMFDNIMEVFHLADDDQCNMLYIVTADGRSICLTAINRDLLRHPVPPDRLFEKTQCRRLVPVLRQEKVNGLPRLIHGAIEIAPLALHLDVRFVQAPTEPHGTLAPMKRFFELWTIFD